MRRGLTVESITYGPIHAELDRQQGDNAWMTMALTEGKNREIRKVCEHFGWAVNRLIRTSYGPFQLGKLPRGDVEEVQGKVLREQLGEGRAPGAAKREPKAGKRARPPRQGQHANRRRLASDRTSTRLNSSH